MAGNHVHLTKDAVSRIAQSGPGQKLFTWDDRLLGFGAYRRSDGIVVFVYQYRRALCRARRITIGRLGDVTPAQARGIAEEYAYQKTKGVDPIDSRREAAREEDASRSLVMATYVAEYIQRRKTERRPLNQQHERLLTRDVAGLMPDVRVDKITTRDIDKFLEDLSQRSISARNFGLVYLKVILNDAKKRGTIVASAADAYTVPTPTERERVLRPSEIQRILEACHDNGSMHGLVYPWGSATWRTSRCPGLSAGSSSPATTTRPAVPAWRRRERRSRRRA